MGEKDCGSAACVEQIDKMGQRLSVTLSMHQDAGFQGLRDLMVAHHNDIAGQVREILERVERDSSKV